MLKYCAMNNLKITSKDLDFIVDDISKKIMNNHMSNVTIVNSFDLFITLSMYRKEKLFISLNPQHPFVSLIQIDNPCPTRIGHLNDVLRKEIRDGYLIKCEKINNDRIICLTYGISNDYFEREERRLIIELIPRRPNLLILNKENKILFVNHSADATNERPLMKGLTYVPPKNENIVPSGTFDFEKFKKAACNYYFQAKERRLQEEFKPLLTHIKSRIKTLKQKLVVLEREIKTAKSNLIYQEHGQMILTYSNDDEELKQYIEENNVDYDKTLNPGINANKCFSKYKKAKRTIEIDNKELEKTKGEIDYLEICLIQTKYMGEEDLIELAELLFPQKFKQQGKKKIESKPGEIAIDGTRIMFGKNAKQNDFLTFKKAQKKDWFFHIKDYHGSHVIVCSESPTKEVILSACEIALILSGKDCGEVQSTQVKNIKKGSVLGQALLTSYETYNINNIRQKTRDLLNK